MPAHTTLNPPRCGACRSTNTSAVAPLPLYVRGGEVTTTLRRCDDCGTFWRDADFDNLVRHGHFDVASYTDLSMETRWRRRRLGFLSWILRLAQRHFAGPSAGMRVCDVGCAFGYILELVAARGGIATGVEIVDPLRSRLASRGFAVHRSIDEIPSTPAFHVVSMIDSFYYFDDPLATLRAIRTRLAGDGILIMRVTNRTPVMRLLQLMGRPISDALAGDVKYNFSYRGIRCLLHEAGYEVTRIYQHERGRRGQRPLTWLYYRLAPLAGRLTGRKLGPGLVLICRPVDNRPSS